MKRAVYPGSFDPITYGHLDVIERGSRIADELVVAIADNAMKTPLFSLDERVAMVRETTSHLPNVSVTSFKGLTVDFVQSQKAAMILRGIRTVSDFEFEFSMALTNRSMAPGIETVFVMSSQKHSFYNSSIVKQIVSLGGDISPFAPECVARRLREKLCGEG